MLLYWQLPVFLAHRTFIKMPPFSLIVIPEILQQRALAQGTIFPGAMQCYALPYGLPGFLGDCLALYIGGRLSQGHPPLPGFRDRKVRHRRIGGCLATVQLLCCVGLGIATVTRCNNSKTSQTGLVLIAIARICLAVFYIFSLVPAFSDKASTVVESSSPAPDSTPNSDRRDPENIAMTSNITPAPQVPSTSARQKTSDEPRLEGATGGPPPPYTTNPTETGSSNDNNQTSGEAQVLARDKELGNGFMFFFYFFASLLLSLITGGVYLVLRDIDALGALKSGSRTQAGFVFVILTGILSLSCCAILLGLLAPVDRIKKAVLGKGGSMPFCLGVMVVTVMAVTVLSDWVLGIAGPGNMPDGSRLDVFVTYWVYFAVSKLLLFVV
ncbi:hypothetical protein B0T16DRAFT_125393 [Cercophora newfieldiana]|uniref:Uncharacterized protein n=1 Tax=Cercophora newfieldiana TaxID=92897 RepID=A0AA39YDM3_9PEZI|nr:hypothetical protein B0T16DRAFT_125393 [Cercophora newfieldiana]